jgi:hypothetical protein
MLPKQITIVPRTKCYKMVLYHQGQIMFVLWMICKIMVMQYQGKTCLGHELNVKMLFWGANTNHVIDVN